MFVLYQHCSKIRQREFGIYVSSNRQCLFWSCSFSHGEAGAVEAVWKWALPFENQKMTDNAAYAGIRALGTIYEDTARDWQNMFIQFVIFGRTHLQHQGNNRCSKMPSSGSLCSAGPVPRLKTEGPAPTLPSPLGNTRGTACLMLRCTLPSGIQARPYTKLYLRAGCGQLGCAFQYHGYQ